MYAELTLDGIVCALLQNNFLWPLNAQIVLIPDGQYKPRQSNCGKKIVVKSDAKIFLEQERHSFSL